MTRRLLLVGGGHAHVHVLAALARAPIPDTEVTLLTPSPRQIYSGMLPGWLAGDYAIDDCAIRIDRLAARAGVRLVLGKCERVDVDAREVSSQAGQRFGFDLLSLDSGPLTRLASMPGAANHALPIRPLEDFIAAWPGLLQGLRSAAEAMLSIVGGGAAGVEVALALAERRRREGLDRLRLRIVDPGSEALAGFPQGVRHRVRRCLADNDILWSGGQRVVACHAEHLELADGSCLRSDVNLLLSGAAAPDWLAGSGCATDPQGFLRVDRTLRSVSHPCVFGAGDIAAYADARPKSGVFAVRAGPVLADNLKASFADRPLRSWTPQRRALYLISTGHQQAIATWGGLHGFGHWAWRWKRSIDRRFIERFS